MGIIQKLKELVSGDESVLFGEINDPEKKIEKYLREMNQDLARVKSETAVIMAEERRAKNNLDACREEISRMEMYAQRALKAGNEEDASRFLAKKADLLNRKAGLETVYEFAVINTRRMRETHDRLVEDIAALNARKGMVQRTIQVVKAHKRIKGIEKRR